MSPLIRIGKFVVVVDKINAWWFEPSRETADDDIILHVLLSGGEISVNLGPEERGRIEMEKKLNRAFGFDC